MRIVSFIVPFIVFTPFILADTIVVPDDYSTIQGAIDASKDGDTVIVKPGTYVENINFKGKGITVKSENGPDVTFIDGGNPSNQNYRSCVLFQNGEGKDSVLDGFTLTNGSGTYESTKGDYHGGGIYCFQSSPTIVNNLVVGNHSVLRGGGICTWDNCSPVIRNNTFVSNTSNGNAGGLYIWFSYPILENNIIIDNTATSGGGGFFIVGGSLIFKNSLIAGNSTDIGGGIYCDHSCILDIINSTICENYANLGGGICINMGSNATVMNTILWNNDASNGNEIAIVSNIDPSDMAISYSDVKGGKNSVLIDPGCTVNWGPGMIDADPLFYDSFENDYHLQQDPCQPGITNPCVDTGDPNTVGIEGSTRTDEVPDVGVVDMGYHYPALVWDYLNADAYAISETAGGIINFSITAGTGNSKRNYLLIGSLSGTEPGIQLPGDLVVLPLNWDLFTYLVITYMNSTFFMNFMGVLDPSGNGAAIFNSQGPLPSGMVGFNFSFAYAVNKPWDFVSNPVNVEVVP